MKALRSQDIYLLLALVAWPADEKRTYQRLSNAVGLSLSQVHRSLSRAESSHLFDKSRRKIHAPELLEFLSHGLRYAFPAIPAQIQRGVPTCWQAPGLEGLMEMSKKEPFVWPAPNGTHRGQAIEPLHKSAITAVTDDDEFYRLLAIADILRVGSARERKVATEELRKALL